MTIRRRCTGKCKKGRRCLEHLRFDVMWRGTRYRVPVNEYAIPLMEPRKQRPIQSMEEARDWERRFIGEVKAGLDPQRPPSPRKPNAKAEIETVSGFLRLEALEDPDEINRFKASSDYAEELEIASIHCVLERLRAAMNWGLAQTPPLFTKSPFHRFGVRMNKKAETVRDRRVSREEEKRLLDTALHKMNDGVHMFVGELLHDRIIGALELCCRRGEMLLIQNKRVNWDTHQIGIPGATAKDKENRRIPFNPKGRLAAILKRRASLGPEAFVFGNTHGAYQPTIQTAWETLKLMADGLAPKAGQDGVKWNHEQLRRLDLRWHDLRHEGACRLLAAGVDIRMIQLMLGHASIQQTQRYLNVTDEELRKGMEVSWGQSLRAVSDG